MKLVFLGSGAFGLPTLEQLAREHEIAAIVSQPDRPAGRNRRLTPTPIAAWAIENLPGVTLMRVENVNDPGVARELRWLGADAWVVIAFGQKLSRSLLEGVFAINLHASLLPRWRGAAPINHAILAGDIETGVSVITLADRMDAGLVLGQYKRASDPAMTAGELHDALAADGPGLVSRVLDEHARGALAPVEQDESRVTVAGKLNKSDGRVDFAATAEECRRRIHGLTPWPGVTVTLSGEQVKLLRVESAGVESDQEPGTLIDPAAGVVAAGAGSALRLITVQPAGRPAMGWTDFARGRKLSTGMKLESGSQC